MLRTAVWTAGQPAHLLGTTGAGRSGLRLFVLDCLCFVDESQRPIEDREPAPRFLVECPLSGGVLRDELPNLLEDRNGLQVVAALIKCSRGLRVETNRSEIVASFRSVIAFAKECSDVEWGHPPNDTSRDQAAGADVNPMSNSSLRQ